MQPKILSNPMVLPHAAADDPAWETVDSGLYSGGALALDAYPLPDGCVDDWRGFLTTNSYQERVWCIQARRATNA